MSRCIIKTKSGRCMNQAAPGKRTCGQHPKRRRNSSYTRKHSAADVLGQWREFDAVTEDGISVADAERFRLMSVGKPDGIIEHDDVIAGAW